MTLIYKTLLLDNGFQLVTENGNAHYNLDGIRLDVDSPSKAGCKYEGEEFLHWEDFLHCFKVRNGKDFKPEISQTHKEIIHKTNP